MACHRDLAGGAAPLIWDDVSHPGFFFLDGWFYCLGGEENAAALELEFSTNMES